MKHAPAPMSLSSPAFEDGATIPRRCTCDGDGHSPPLVFDHVPQGAKSLVLLVIDTDVPTSVRAEGEWDHWLVWNMPATTVGIAEGEGAPGIVGRNTSGTHEYAAPCPPDREHRYFFNLLALDCELDLPKAHATRADIEKAMEGHILAKAQLMGRYERGKG